MKYREFDDGILALCLCMCMYTVTNICCGGVVTYRFHTLMVFTVETETKCCF